jgi:hypothetical protein
MGIAALACIVFAGLKAPRRWLRTWRIGSAQFWMRGHLWLGTLALPLVLFHGGMRHGGTLTSVLMWLMYIITGTGILGAILQHTLPKMMTKKLPDETIYEQIPQVIQHLAAEADDAAAICGPAEGTDVGEWRKEKAAAIKVREGKALMTAQRREQLLAMVAAAPAEKSAPLRDFYLTAVRPYLSEANGDSVGLASASATTARCASESKQPVVVPSTTADVPLAKASPTRSALASRKLAAGLFAQYRESLPETLTETVNDLEKICDECRQLRLQRRLHHWLHAWLLIHIPLSAALFVLILLHIVFALRY